MHTTVYILSHCFQKHTMYLALSPRLSHLFNVAACNIEKVEGPGAEATMYQYNYVCKVYVFLPFV